LRAFSRASTSESTCASVSGPPRRAEYPGIPLSVLPSATHERSAFRSSPETGSTTAYAASCRWHMAHTLS